MGITRFVDFSSYSPCKTFDLGPSGYTTSGRNSCTRNVLAVAVNLGVEYLVGLYNLAYNDRSHMFAHPRLVG